MRPKSTKRFSQEIAWLSSTEEEGVWSSKCRWKKLSRVNTFPSWSSRKSIKEVIDDVWIRGLAWPLLSLKEFIHVYLMHILNLSAKTCSLCPPPPPNYFLFRKQNTYSSCILDVLQGMSSCWRIQFWAGQCTWCMWVNIGDCTEINCT